MSGRTDGSDEDIETGHLESVEDGCGCTEIWEHLSDERDEASET
jgi:hypothetical protein